MIANDQIRSLTEKLRKVETDRMGPSPGGSRVAGPSLASSTESTSEQVRIGVLGSDNFARFPDSCFYRSDHSLAV